MTYALAANITCCIVGDQPVLLDIKKGRFFSPSAQAARAFQRWFRQQALESEDNNQLKALFEQGVFTQIPDDQSARSNPASTVSPVCAELPAMASSSTQFGLVRTVAIQLLWNWRTKNWPLSRLVGLMQAARLRVRELNSSDPVDLTRIVANFARADLMLGYHDRCLARSVALGATVRASSIDVDVVIGVRADPFAAHCWVQQGDTVINDSHEQVRPFTPILVM